MASTTTPTEALVQHVITQAMDRLVHGLAIVDAHRRVLYLNTAGQRALARAGWAVQDGLLASVDGCRGWNDFLRLLDDVCARRRYGLLEAGSFAQPPIHVSLSPLLLEAAPLAIATFEREDLCSELELQLFCRRRGLTHAERSVLWKLCQGQRPADIAREHGVARSTVLTQVAAIRSKTDASSVQDFLGTLSRLPATATPTLARVRAA